jgi:hypothetical protein
MKTVNLLKSIFLISLLIIPISCSENSIPVEAALTKLLVGKWMNTKVNNEPVLTDASYVMEFRTDYVEKYAVGFQLDDNNKTWMENSNYSYSVSDHILIVDGTDVLNKKYHMEFKILTLNETTFTYSVIAFRIDGVDYQNSNSYTCKKITQDYSSQFVGVWYGRCTSDNNNDSSYHYWEYFADGTYSYYYQDQNNKWIKKSNNEGKYFLYENLIVSNYSNDLQSGNIGKAYECWNFSITGDTMTWTGLRENNKTVTYEMVKVDKSPLE